MYVVIKITSSGEILGKVVSNHIKKENAITAAGKNAGCVAYETNTRWVVGHRIRKVFASITGTITLRSVR
jgi:hypothetical protein